MVYNNKHFKLFACLATFAVILFFGFVGPALSQDLNYRGQVSAWGGRFDNEDTSYQLGLRYLPEVNPLLYSKGTYTIDAGAATNLFAVQDFSPNNTDHDEKLYRLWLRFTTNQLEIRAGLQKINFGSAYLLRSLMWFDTLDPRDPQQLTDGVYGVLVRYFFLNNANVWLWGLYGNDKLKGSEFVYTNKEVPEWGGRVQYPVGPGDVALTYHRRKIDLVRSCESVFSMPAFIDLPQVWEDRYAFDCKWDYYLGLWFETVANRFEGPILNYQYLNQFTFGADYTFGLGNGLHVSAEHYVMCLDEKYTIRDEYEYTAVMVDYPVNMFDRLVGMMMYDNRYREYYWYGALQRNYDNWSFNAMCFVSPEIASRDLSGAFMQSPGKNIQIMAIYTH